MGHPHPQHSLPGKARPSTQGQASVAVTGTEGDFRVSGAQRNQSLSRAACAPRPRARAVPLPSGPAAHHEPLRSGPPLLLPVRPEHDPGVLGAAQRPLQVPLRALDGQQQGGWRQADTAFEVGSSEQRREGAGGRPRSQPCPLPPHPYPIASSINLTLEPSRAGLSSHPVGLGLTHQPRGDVLCGGGGEVPGGRGQYGRGVGEQTSGGCLHPSFGSPSVVCKSCRQEQVSRT